MSGWLIGVLVVVYLAIGFFCMGIVLKDDTDGGLIFLSILFWPFLIMVGLGIAARERSEKKDE